MWHLQLPKFNQQHNYFLKLLCGSLIFHLSICILLFFVYSDSQKLQFEVSSIPRDIIVQLATVSSPKRSGIKAGTQSNILKTATSTKTTQKTGFIKKEIIQKKAKPAAKKIKQTLKKTPGKKEIKKTETPKPLVEKPVTQPEVKTEQKRESVSPTEPQIAPQVIEVTQQELNQLELEQLVQDTIATVWAPPAGMDTSLVCKVTLTIDWQGTITETVLTEPSSVLVYNIAVEKTVSELQFPRQLWGKTITLVFKP